MLNVKRCGAASVLVAALVLPHGRVAQAKPIGFVLRLDGAWLADGKPIQLGQELLAGSSLSLSPGTTMASERSIAVVLADSTRIQRSCKTIDLCRFTLPASLNAPTTVLSRLADAFNLIFTRSDRYVSTLSRGAPSRVGNLADGVMKIDAGSPSQIDAAPLLHDVDAGRYVLQFNALSREDAAAAPASTIRIEWNAARPRVALPAGVGPGLYRVTLFSAASPDADPLGDDAWALVATAPTYERTRASFAAAAAIADSWGADAAKDRRVFLRATLDHLARAR